MCAISSQLVGGMIAGPNSASMMANLAMKPDSGGRPDSNSVQKMKPPPRIAIVPGMTMPVSSSSSSSAPVYSSSNTGSRIRGALSPSSTLRPTGSMLPYSAPTPSIELTSKHNNAADTATPPQPTAAHTYHDQPLPLSPRTRGNATTEEHQTR